MAELYEAYANEARCATQSRPSGWLCRRGVAGYWMGPSFETPAEVRLAQMAGCAISSNSFLPEVMAGYHAGMKVVAFTFVSTMSAGIGPAHRPRARAGADPPGARRLPHHPARGDSGPGDRRLTSDALLDRLASVRPDAHETVRALVAAIDAAGQAFDCAQAPAPVPPRYSASGSWPSGSLGRSSSA